MNTYFSSVGENLANKLGETHMSFENYLGSPNANSMYLELADEVEVGNLVLGTNIKKSMAIYNIPPLLLLWGSPILIPTLTKLFNQCISNGVYPDCLKIAKVIPIFKGGEKI